MMGITLAMEITVILRGFAANQQIFEETIRVASSTGLVALVKGHPLLVGYPRYMIEVEFVEEPDPDLRFQRYGNDPVLLSMPFREASASIP
jgi:hypothetical protein